MAKIILRIFILLSSSTLISCNKDGCSFASGSLSRQTRSVSSFNEIMLYDKINLILTEDSILTLSIEAKENLLNGITTNVSNGVLTIKNANHCTLLTNPDEQVNVDISLTQLQQISYYGAGNIISLNTLHSDHFTLDSWYGTGTVKMDILTNQLNAYIRNNNAQLIFTGQSNTTTIFCAEEGSMDMFGLNTVNLVLNQRSIRDINVNVSGLFQAVVAYKGNVYYKGNPVKIDSLITNSGRLIHVQ